LVLPPFSVYDTVGFPTEIAITLTACECFAFFYDNQLTHLFFAIIKCAQSKINLNFWDKSVGKGQNMPTTTQKNTVETYSAKSFVVRGDTFQVKEELKNMGGKWNKFLKGGAGWIFSNNQKTEVEEWFLKRTRAKAEEYEEEYEEGTWSDKQHRRLVAKRKWEELLRKYPQLSSFELVFNKRLTSSAGLCRMGARKTVELSDIMIEDEDTTEWDVIDTLIHEAAHALAGPGKGHGPVWINWNKKLGGSGERCHNMTFANKNAKGFWRCSNCDNKDPIKNISRNVKECLAGRCVFRCLKCRSQMYVELI